MREDCATLYEKYQELLMSKCELEAAENRAKKIVETLHSEIFKLTEENSKLKQELAGYNTGHLTNYERPKPSENSKNTGETTDKSALKKHTPQKQTPKSKPVVETPKLEENKNSRRKSPPIPKVENTQQFDDKSVDSYNSDDSADLAEEKPAILMKPAVFAKNVKTAKDVKLPALDQDSDSSEYTDNVFLQDLE